MQFLHRLEAWYSHEYYDRKIITILGTPFIIKHTVKLLSFGYKTQIVPR